MALIEINLLPEEKRKKTSTRLAIPKIPQVKSFLPLVVGLVALVLTIHALLFVALIWNKTVYNVLYKKWKSLEPDKKEVDKLKSEAARMDKKITVVEQLLASRFSWADALKSINECVVSGIWLNSFVLGGKTDTATGKGVFLSLTGSVVTIGGQGTATIGKFMNNLKQNKKLAQDFEEIELGSIQRKNIRETEIMDFTITAYFKKDKVVF